MQRIFLVVGTLAAALLSLVNAKEESDKLPAYPVKCVLEGADGESVTHESLLIQDGVSTDIPVVTTTKLGGGDIAEEWGEFEFVPSPDLIANPPTKANRRFKEGLERIAMDARFICRIRRIDEARLLLDVVLSDVDSIKADDDVQPGFLKVTTHTLRSVQPVRRGEPVTLTWPAAEGVKKPRQVTITVLESK